MFFQTISGDGVEKLRIDDIVLCCPVLAFEYQRSEYFLYSTCSGNGGKIFRYQKIVLEMIKNCQKAEMGRL